MMINQLTSGEEHLMMEFWKMQTFYSKDIMERLPEPKPHQNTISTYLKILVTKGFLTTKKEGRIFQYKVAISFEDYKKSVLKHFIELYYNGNVKLLLSDLNTEKILKAEDLKDFVSLEFTQSSESNKNQVHENRITDLIGEIMSDKKSKKKKKAKKEKKNKKKKN